VVGAYDGLLKHLIGLYKFERARSAYRDLGDLLLARLPDLPKNTIVVPIPTITKHVRERGYDHTLLLAKYIATRKGLTCRRLLKRATNTKQRQASAALRESQAKKAFITKVKKLEANIPYLIIDDVVTTGATIKYAARTLRRVGAKHIWVAAIAHQL
jgi:ComF family protein